MRIRATSIAINFVECVLLFKAKTMEGEKEGTDDWLTPAYLAIELLLSL